jgi:hypothetical protein
MTLGVLKALFPLLLVTSIASSQPFRIGVEGGVPLTDAFSTASPTAVSISSLNYSSATRRYTVGATAEVRLPSHLSIKADVLYKRLGFDSTYVPLPLINNVICISCPQTLITSATTANSFEFPVLAKYRIGKLGPLRPYVEGGVAFRTIQGMKQVSQTSTINPCVSVCPVVPAPTTGSTTGPGGELSHSFTKGVTAGAGVEFQHFPLPVGVFGEVRYTRWTAEAFAAPSGGLTSLKDQADVLVGVTF